MQAERLYFRNRKLLVLIMVNSYLPDLSNNSFLPLFSQHTSLKLRCEHDPLSPSFIISWTFLLATLTHSPASSQMAVAPHNVFEVIKLQSVKTHSFICCPLRALFYHKIPTLSAKCFEKLSALPRQQHCRRRAKTARSPFCVFYIFPSYVPFHFLSRCVDKSIYLNTVCQYH